MSSAFYSSPTAQLVERQASIRQVMGSSPTRIRILFYARLCTVIVHCVTMKDVVCSNISKGTKCSYGTVVRLHAGKQEGNQEMVSTLKDV